MSHSIEVSFSENVMYPVTVGNNLWDDVIRYCAERYAARKVFVVVDSNVNSLYGAKVVKELERFFESCHIIEIPEGEKSKSLHQWTRLQDELLEGGVERSTPLIAVGGGVTGDLAGYAAASVLRGIPLIHMPTSLLAMVDSSIGGKTGINHSAGKNLIGAFYQPDAVFADVEFLRTLDRNEWIGGMSEMLKYAAIREPEMFDELEQAAKRGFEPSDQWLELIRKSAEIKIDIVQQDVHEAGKRAYLNFGHTFGHALEKCAGYGNISHGEAVFTGMIAAVYYSKKLGAPVDEARFDAFKPLYDINLPSGERIPELIEAMKSDKKVEQETIRLILLDAWGEPCIRKCEHRERLHEAWETALNGLRKSN